MMAMHTSSAAMVTKYCWRTVAPHRWQNASMPSFSREMSRLSPRMVRLNTRSGSKAALRRRPSRCHSRNRARDTTSVTGYSHQNPSREVRENTAVQGSSTTHPRNRAMKKALRSSSTPW